MKPTIQKKETPCAGCFTIIAPHDPSAFFRGTQHFHSTACYRMYEIRQARNWNLYAQSLAKKAVMH
jgi:hypothetical protein